MHTNTSALLRDLRNWHGDHNEVMSFFHCLISVIDNNEHPLTEKCKTVLAELLCQCADAVDDDKVEQFTAQQFIDSKRKLAAQVWYGQEKEA